MLKQLNASRALIGSSLFLLFVGSFFIATPGGLGIRAEATWQTKVSQSVQSAGRCRQSRHSSLSI